MTTDFRAGAIPAGAPEHLEHGLVLSLHPQAASRVYIPLDIIVSEGLGACDFGLDHT